MQIPTSTTPPRVDPASRKRRLGLRHWGVCMLLASLSASALAGASSSAAAQDHEPARRHTISYDRYSLKIDGRRIYVWSGSFHYWRLPSPSLWTDVFQKMKAAGYNTVEIYFNWAYHSPRKGRYDFSGIRDVDRVLDDAQKAGLYVIARPGPYINAETDAGGFPDWLIAVKGRARSPAPDYTAAYKEWLTRIDRILARHQLTNGTGSVILYQVENEFYDNSPAGRRYMRDIEQKARADGITVPLVGNHNGSFEHGVGAIDIPGYDDYPLGFDCSRPQQWSELYDYTRERRALTHAPLFFPEYQGGSFDPWGGPGYAKCRQLTGPAFERVYYEAMMASGSTMQNFYMTYGGINWGWLASPGVYTSYDYAAPIDAARRLTAKYDQQKLLGYFTRAVQPLTQTDRMAAKSPDNPALRLDARINPVDDTQFYILRHADARSTAADSTHLWLDLGRGDRSSAAALDRYTRIPQQAGTALRIDGRDSKILLADYHFGGQNLLYSTSDWMTNLSQGKRDIAVIYGRRGEDGETVFTYRAKPSVQVLSGKVVTAWDATRGQLRLNYTHEGLTRVLIQSGQHSLLLLIGDDQTAERFWKLDTQSGAVLVRGPYLVRTASLAAAPAVPRTIELTGDTDKATTVEVFAPADVHEFTWNGHPVHAETTPSGSLLGQLDGPQPVTLPQLTDWKYQPGAPEIQPSFDDSHWPAANRKSSNNPNWNGHLPILNSDDYGFHHGNVWYRGHFTATGREQGVILAASPGTHQGNHGRFTVWLNGRYLGDYPSGASYFGFDPADLKVGKDNVLSVLVGNMGHNQDGSGDDLFKQPRGLESATLLGASPTIKWKIQGDRGGEVPADPVRGPMNNGGLYGERMGWSLPGYPDQGWTAATMPRTTSTPGVDWYRITFTLDVPVGQDVPIGLKISDDPSRHYRALIFISGWQVGRYINATGPQRVFNLPAGLLNPHGRNTIAIADWNTGTRGGLGKVSLVTLGNYRSALHVRLVPAPGYRELFASPAGAASGKTSAHPPKH